MVLSVVGHDFNASKKLVALLESLQEPVGIVVASSTVSYRSAIDGLRTVPTAVSIGALGIVYGDLRLKGSRSNAVARRSLLVSKCTPGAKMLITP